MKYAHILSLLHDKPWCITESKLDAISALLHSRAFSSDAEAERRLQEWRAEHPQAKAAKREAASLASVGIVPIIGTLVRRANMATEYSGGTSMQITAQTIDQMAADPNVSGILLDIDSPGGTHDGTPELAAAVARAAKQKPVFASANGLAASAAYWIASQATELAVAPSGEVGSIGTVMVHFDSSEAYAKEGVKPTIIRSGENKYEGSSLEPLAESSRKFFQEMVDGITQEFVKSVAEGRGVSQTQVRENFGQGRAFLAKDAKQRGMVDRVEPIEETLARLLRRVSRDGGGSGARSQIETVREFETFLRDEGRFSHSVAKRIAAEGFGQCSPRDEAQEAAEILKEVSEFVSEISKPRGG